MRTLVVVPTYNEAGTLGELHGRLREALPAVDLLVVHDASPDGTGAVADALAQDDGHVSVLHRPGKAGLGSAYRAGFRVLEIPITFVERRQGTSKISRRIVAEAVLRTALWGLAGPRGPAVTHPESVAAA